jgi:D-alanyl-lipoteichoic acid acyltransferase DltB (MBOAT superfamily)
VGGNRNGNRTRNVFITMLLGGLWHGAAWTFVIWGAWHGFIISVTHWLTYSAIGRWVDARNNWLVRIFKVLVTFYLVVIGWVFFRATGFDNAWTMLSQMHMSTGVEASASSLVVLGLVVAGLVFMHLTDWLNIRFGSALNERSWLMWPILVVGFSLFLVVGDPGHDFIYFQF